MGWFSKKDKLTATRETTATPDTSTSNPYAAPAPSYNSSTEGNKDSSSGYGGSSKQMTAGQEKEEDADVLEQQTRLTKQESVSWDRNALPAAARAEGVSKTARALNEEEHIMERHRLAREEREKIQAAEMQGQRRVESGLRQSTQSAGALRQKMTLAEKARYQFEADVEDDQMEMEMEVDNNSGQLGDVIGRLHELARASKLTEDQNKAIFEKLNQKRSVPPEIDHNTHRLNKIKD